MSWIFNFGFVYITIKSCFSKILQVLYYYSSNGSERIKYSDITPLASVHRIKTSIRSRYRFKVYIKAKSMNIRNPCRMKWKNKLKYFRLQFVALIQMRAKYWMAKYECAFWKTTKIYYMEIDYFGACAFTDTHFYKIK